VKREAGCNVDVFPLHDSTASSVRKPNFSATVSATFQQVPKQRRKQELTARKVPGKKTMPTIEMVFIVELSSLLAFARKLLSSAIVLIAALPSLLASARIEE
jgi:hypothetical protein